MDRIRSQSCCGTDDPSVYFQAADHSGVSDPPFHSGHKHPAFSLVIYEYKKEALAPFKYNRETENAKTIAILLLKSRQPRCQEFPSK